MTQDEFRTKFGDLKNTRHRLFEKSIEPVKAAAAALHDANLHTQAGRLDEIIFQLEANSEELGAILHDGLEHMLAMMKEQA